MRRNDRDGHDRDEHDRDGHEMDKDGQDAMECVAFSDRSVWQRLVDNRLSDQEYRQLLLDLETRPRLWRDCALAFLEDQALSQALRQCRADAEGPVRADGSANVTRGSGVGLVASTGAQPLRGGGTQTEDFPPGGVGGLQRRGAGNWSQPLLVTVSLAAGFMLAVFAFSQRFADVGVPAAESRLGGAAGQPVVPVGEPLVLDRESFKDFLADLPPEQRRELFQRPTQQRVSPTVAARPASLVPGQVQAERRFLFYRTADGGMIVVPVDDYRFVAQEFQ